MRKLFYTISLGIIFHSLCIDAQQIGNLQHGDYGYLFCHMSDRGEWTAFALSRDGLHYHDLLAGNSIFDTKEVAAIEGGTRDAYICRKHDGSGYLMVTTDMKVAVSHKWDNYGIDLLTSNDLINWKSTTFDFRKGVSIFSNPDDQSVYNDWTTINRVWAPQIFWDTDFVWPNGNKGGYMIYFSMLNRAEEQYDRMYYCHADETFTQLTQPQILFDWGYATIDADINYVPADSLYHMMIKKEGGQTGLFTSMSKSLTGPWSAPLDDDYVNFEGKKKCEGVSAFQLIGDSTWHIGYIEYSSRPKHYRICEADKYMQNFSNPRDIEGVNGPQHGSFMRLTQEEYFRLQAWSDSILAPLMPDFSSCNAHLHHTTNTTELIEQYRLNKSQWDEAINWLKSNDLRNIKKGKYKINEQLTASVEDSYNEPLEQRQSESHYNHIDLQFVISGTEGFTLLDHATSTENCPWRDDIVHYNYDKTLMQYIEGEAGTMFLFFPSDWHIAKIATNKNDQNFRVIVIKLDYVKK